MPRYLLTGYTNYSDHAAKANTRKLINYFSYETERVFNLNGFAYIYNESLGQDFNA